MLNELLLPLLFQVSLVGAFRSIFVTERCRSKTIYLAAGRRHARVLFASNNEGLPNAGQQERRKKKLNKYAKFSKTKDQVKDPWETLMDETIQKTKRLEVEKNLKTNKVKIEDVKEFVDEQFLSAAEKKNELLRNAAKNITFPNATAINPYDPTTFGYIELGTISTPHGVKGQVKLLAASDFATERLCPTSTSDPFIRHLKARNRRSPRKITLLEGKPQIDNVYILKFEGIGTREDAMKLKGSVLYAREEDDGPELEEDEYIVSDLVGLEVFLDDSFYIENDKEEENEGFVGSVNGIVLNEDLGGIPGLGNDYLEVALPRAEGQKEEDLVLIPFVPQIVPKVDLDARCILINPPNGLLDLSYVRTQRVRIRGFLPEKSSYPR